VVSLGFHLRPFFWDSRATAQYELCLTHLLRPTCEASTLWCCLLISAWLIVGLSLCGGLLVILIVGLIVTVFIHHRRQRKKSVFSPPSSLALALTTVTLRCRLIEAQN